MKLISPLLKHVIYPGLSRAGYLRRSRPGKPVVLTYHGVLPPGYKVIDSTLDGNLLTAEEFRCQLRFLSKHYHVISPQDFLHGNRSLPAESVLLTCDDGLRNNLTDMLPILQEFGFACLFFVTNACLDDEPTMLWCDELFLMLLDARESIRVRLPGLDTVLRLDSRKHKLQSWWQLIKQLSRVDAERRRVILEDLRDHLDLPEDWSSKYCSDPTLSRRYLTMNSQQLQELVEAGMSIGAHTVSHPMLSQLPTEFAWSEISDNRKRLTEVLGEDIQAFAYPFGDATAVSARDKKMAQAAGFAWAFLNCDRDCVECRYGFPRVHVTSGMNLGQFEAHLSGFHQALQSRFAVLSTMPTAIAG